MLSLSALNTSEIKAFQELISQWGETEAGIDTGEETTLFQAGQFVRIQGKPDGAASSREIYARLVPLAEKNSSLWRFASALGVEVPWSSTADLDSGSKDDEALKAWVTKTMAAVDASPAVSSATGFSRALARATGLFEAMRRGTSEGGLGLQFDALEQNSLRGGAGVYRDRSANCVEFVSVYLMAADMAGLPAVPVELLKDSAGAAQEHVRIGIVNETTGAVEASVDLATGRAGANASGELWNRMSRLDFLSYYYMTRGVRENRWDDVRLAHRMNPSNYFVLYNMAAFSFREGEARYADKKPEKARKLYEEARLFLTGSIAAYPNYRPAQDALRVTAQKLNALSPH